MVYVEGNHPAIVSKAMFYQVREEMARRGSKRKVMQKTGKTEQGKYSAKYALSELLVCGECGTPYKRCTWARNGKKRIVWRCVSRLEFSTFSQNLLLSCSPIHTPRMSFVPSMVMPKTT